MCDIVDTTYLYPFTTTVAAKTTAKRKETTSSRDTPSTSHPPTSVPTEGKIRAGSRLQNILCNDGCFILAVHVLDLFFIVFDVFPVLQRQDTPRFWKMHKYVLQRSTYIKDLHIFQMTISGTQCSSCVCTNFKKECRLNQDKSHQSKIEAPHRPGIISFC